MKAIVIQQRIYEIRGQKIMFDFDLAELYKVETKVLNQAVKRNASRFPADFMIHLTKKEWDFLRSQFVTLETGRGRHSKYLPYAFTEHGVTMAASILKSDRAAKMNVAIVRAFVALKEFALNYRELSNQITEIKKTVSNHSEQLNQIYNAIENMLDEKQEKKSWDKRERIGFKSARK